MRWLGILVLILLVACAPRANVIKLPATPDSPNIPNQELIQEIQEFEEELGEPEGIGFPDTPLGNWHSIVFNTSRINNYQYTITLGITGGATYKVRSHLQRIDYHRPKSIVNGRIIDVVYFDNDDRTAVGFCRSHEIPCEPYAGERFILNYNQFHTLTPKDWIDQFKRQAPTEYIPNAQIINSRDVDQFTFKNPLGQTIIFIDTFTKLPTRVQEQSANSKINYDFDDILIGKVKAKEVFH